MWGKDATYWLLGAMLLAWFVLWLAARWIERVLRRQNEAVSALNDDE